MGAKDLAQQGDVVVAHVHLLTGIWTERIHPDGTEEPAPGPLTHAIVNAALAHAGALLVLAGTVGVDQEFFVAQ